MRAPMLRRTAYFATLATGVGLTAAGFSGLSQVDTSLKLAAATNETRTALASDRWDGECDRGDGPPPLRHRV
jgi:hypothetical protein